MWVWSQVPSPYDNTWGHEISEAGMNAAIYWWLNLKFEIPYLLVFNIFFNDEHIFG